MTDRTQPLASAPIASRSGARRRLGLQGELLLALLPTATVLLVLALVEAFSRQRLLFASLASSAFLIYLDPQHHVNSVRTLILSQILAAGLGFGFYKLIGPGYLSAALAMVLVIGALIILDSLHPPAIATELNFSFKGDDESNLLLFGLAVGLVAVLVTLQRTSKWLLLRLTPVETEANDAKEDAHERAPTPD